MDARFYPPSGLDRGTPRPVRLTGAGRMLTIVIVALFVGGPAVGYAIQRQATRERDEQQRIAESPTTSEGVITRLWRPSKDSKQPKVAYTFVDAGGRTWTADAKISTDAWTGLRVGDPIRIRFVASDPRLNRPDGTRARVMPQFVPYLLGGLLVVIGALSILPLRIERRLLTEGRAAPAVVKQHFTHRSQHGTHRSMRYEFELMNGAKASGRAGTTAKPPAIDSVIWVVYDPEHTKLSKPYPLKLVRLADPANW